MMALHETCTAFGPFQTLTSLLTDSLQDKPCIGLALQSRVYASSELGVDAAAAAAAQRVLWPRRRQLEGNALP